MTTTTEPNNFPEHTEDFDVIFIKDGVSELSAKPDDFKRLGVTAKDPIAAQTCDEVKKVMAEGYRVLFAAPPGVMTDPEIQARRRIMDSDPIDRTKL